MKIQIDLKSAVCGLLLGVVTMLCLGAAPGRPDQIRRYEVVTGTTGTGGYALLLDTTTGKVWGRVRDFAHDGNFFDEK